MRNFNIPPPPETRPFVGGKHPQPSPPPPPKTAVFQPVTLRIAPIVINVHMPKGLDLGVIASLEAD